ncbi:hypothetical protein [Streptomyces sp. NPDC058401]|uniref:hypothetical protein n=1 Tax=Streptomyces sp. NPDC058401 TaxID=3346480 RepID=UPI00365BC1DE
MSSQVPDSVGASEEVLLLVHVRKVVGEVQYRMCRTCAEAVITGVDMDARFRGTGLDTRALAHLRARHPGLAWHSTLNLRGTRDLLRRSRVVSGFGLCAHVGRWGARAVQAAP